MRVKRKGVKKMTNLILLIVIIAVGVYFRTRFDKEYTMPVIKENKDLSFLYRVCLFLLGLAVAFMLTGLKVIGFWLLILMIPFVLYFNLKTYGIALGKFFKKK